MNSAREMGTVYAQTSPALGKSHQSTCLSPKSKKTCARLFPCVAIFRARTYYSLVNGSSIFRNASGLVASFSVAPHMCGCSPEQPSRIRLLACLFPQEDRQLVFSGHRRNFFSSLLISCNQMKSAIRRKGIFTAPIT